MKNIFTRFTKWAETVNNIISVLYLIVLAAIGYFAICKKLFGFDVIQAFKAWVTAKNDENKENGEEEYDGEGTSYDAADVEWDA